MSSNYIYTAHSVIGFSSNDSSYKILILPFDRLQKDLTKELKLEKVILNEFNKFRGDGINAKYDSTFKITGSDNIPDSIGLVRNADLVLTGRYYEASKLTKLVFSQIFRNAIGRNGTAILETYINIEPTDKIIFDVITVNQEFKNLYYSDEDIINGKLNINILGYAYYSLAMRSLHANKWKDCISLFNKIPDFKDDTFSLHCKSCCFYYLGDIRNYISNEEKRYALDHSNKNILSEIGKTFEMLNESDSAEFYYKKSRYK